jgi:sugar phosphate isomerase/epimerase
MSALPALSRRDWLLTAAAGSSAAAFAAALPAQEKAAPAQETSIGFGLVTYMWGAEWDLPTLLANCKKTGALGVELRTTHAHKVEPSLNEKQRAEVQQRFADSGVTLVGLGSNERFDHPDPAALQKAIEATKEFIRLSHDIGGSGVKVKPDSFPKDVSREKTIEQIGKSLNELGEYAAGFGQQVRLEVHGGCAELPTIKAIMDIAKDDNVAVCWNSNPTDLKGDGLEQNFAMVAKRFGRTCHVHELDSQDYPYAQLFKLLVQAQYEGWVLLEAASKRENYVTALEFQRKLFDKLLAEAAKG